jgi:hypothetical protein
MSGPRSRSGGSSTVRTASRCDKKGAQPDLCRASRDDEEAADRVTSVREPFYGSGDRDVHASRTRRASAARVSAGTKAASAARSVARTSSAQVKPSASAASAYSSDSVVPEIVRLSVLSPT